MRSLTFALLLVPTLAFSQTVDKDPKVRDEVLKTLKTTIEQKAFVPGIDFKKWDTFFEGEKEKILAAKTDDDFKSAVNIALKKFGFSHILLSTPKDVDSRKTGTSVGIGITSRPVPEGRQVTRVFEGSAAAAVGLEVGDIITHFNGEPITDKTVMTGENGSTLVLKVKKQNGKTFEYKLTRRPFSTVRKDELQWIKGDTALLKVNSFDKGYNKERIEALMEDAVKATNLIIDLRFNGGGAVLNLMDLSGYFLDEKHSMGAMLNKNSVDRFKRKFDKEPANLQDLVPFSFLKLGPVPQEKVFKGNVVILINSGTGSASEIFTAAMKELYHKSVNSSGTLTVEKDKSEVTVIGSKSAGAVLFSTYFETAHGFYLQTPIADYLTPSGVRLEGNPIVPDATAEEPKSFLPGSPDKQVDAALSIFERIRLRKERGKSGY